jgi:glycogenin glucosyltransferase
MPNAWVTLATNDGYGLGALVLGHSLRKAKTAHKLHVLITDGVSQPLRDQLSALYDGVSTVNVLDSNDTENLALSGRADLGITFTKLHCWRLTQYEKCVFLDADTLVIQNSDELFERPEIAAAPDIGWPDCFNSGVFVFEPSVETYRKLLQFAVTHGSFDGGDQGLLNEYFNNWWELSAEHRLPFIYNVSRAIIYTYAPALKRFADKIKIVHFLGKEKPWHKDAPKGSVHFAQWQALYDAHVRQQLPGNVVRLPAPSSNLRLTLVRSSPNEPVESSLPSDVLEALSTALDESIENVETVLSSALEAVSTEEDDPHYQAWESGAPDYSGRDAFENIQRQIDSSLKK